MANIPKVWNGTAFIELEAAATVSPAASTTVVGMVQLSDSTSTTSSVLAATPTAVKAAYDQAELKVSGVTGTSPIASSGGTTPVISIAAATTSVVGAVQLSDSTSTTSSVLAATPTAVKSAYDLAAAAQPKLVVTNAQTGTTYTLVIGDAGKLIEMSNAAAITLTIPANSSVAFPTGTQIDLLQTGAGQVTVGGAGVTLQSEGTKLKLKDQYAAATLIKRDTDTWVLIGNTSA